MKVLIIEDEHKIANSIKKGLEQEKYIVDVSYDGVEGFDLASTEEYALIILDLMLPGLNGIDICKKLRTRGVNTPILILTAKSEVDDKVTGLDSGADDYLAKPFAFTELLARVRALSRRSKDKIQTVLKVGNLSLNTETYEVKRKNTTITLSKKEYSLLEFMMKNKGRLISKEEIITKVWNYESDILPNTVEVFIGYLRKKVDRAFSGEDPLISTSRGFGYKLG